MTASRPRWCVVCGHLHYSQTGYCAAHRDLAALDRLPPDHLTSLPMQAAGLTQGEESTTRKGKES